MRAAGGLFIADEVQPGFGRTAAQMWGFPRHGIVPDLVTMGKPMGNGHPVAGMVARPRSSRSSARARATSTPSAATRYPPAAGIAVLDVIESEGLIENAADWGLTCSSSCGSCRRGTADRRVRGAGLFIGVELRRGGKATLPASEMRAVVKGCANGAC